MTQPYPEEYTFSLASWNVNGWTLANGVLRAKIIQELAPDIISISESHCANDSNSQPSVEGYTWIGHCRKSRHRNSVRNFGGVGIFINNRLLKHA